MPEVSPNAAPTPLVPGGGRAAPAAVPATGDRLDRWVDCYAGRTAGLTASAVRALFAVASRPEVVSFAGGMPDISGLPLQELAATVAGQVTGHGTTALQYGSGQGAPALRELIPSVMSAQRVRAHPDDIVVTTGSQQALDLVTRIFVDPGDVVLAESPSYVGALGVFRSFQAEVVHVPLDSQGLVPEALEATLRDLARAGRRVKFLYTIPNHHNPAGVTLAPERRPRIVEIARRYGVLILEDDPYGLLGFHGDPPPSLQSLDPGGVVYLGSFSKTLAPGLRVGWAVAPAPVRERLVLAAEAAGLCPSAFAQAVVAAYLTEHDWLAQVHRYRALYRERAGAMLEALDEHLPGCDRTTPDGGFFVWLTLPEGLDATAMLPRAVTARVAYVPGASFYADPDGLLGRHQMRLSYCLPTPDRIREGVQRLAGVVTAERELLQAFGTPPAGRPLPGTAYPAPDQG